MNARTASQDRKTAETNISVTINLDGSGTSDISTGVPFFDHMLTLLSKHSLIDLTVKAIGDIEVDAHHTVEDTGIVLGDCIRQALGDKKGIRRYGSAYLPMDETLSRCVIDLSNRPHLEFRAPTSTPDAPNFPFTLTEEFCRAITNNFEPTSTSNSFMDVTATTLPSPSLRRLRVLCVRRSRLTLVKRASPAPRRLSSQFVD